MSAADRAALSSELVSSPEACRLFWEYAHQHAMLADLLAEAQGRELAELERCGTCGPLTPLPLTRPASGPPSAVPTRPMPATKRPRPIVRIMRWSAVAAAA